MYAVYGTLRKGNGNHYLIEKSEYLGTMKTPPIFTLMDIGPFPAVVNGSSKVVVEVYKIDKETEQTLFRLEGYNPNGQNNLYEVCTFECELGWVNIFIMKPYQVRSYKEIKSGDWNKWKQRNMAR